ncbi:MAG: WD40 repeat domain-containing protein [Chloroflexaceae bacterium]|nr:WD40 repeat domain-containing protein [Chloroflexaceae bacterium]
MPIKKTPQQARLNLCLLLVVTFLAILLLGVLIVGVFLVVVLKPGAEETTPAPARETPQPGRSISLPTSTPTPLVASQPFSLNTATVGNITEVRQMTEGKVGVAQYAPDGHLIAIAMGNDLLLYDPLNQVILSTLKGHTGAVNALAFSPVLDQGMPTLLASGAMDETSLLVWDVQTGRSLWRLEGHTGWIRSLAFSPDGSLLASASTDRTIRVWDVQQGGTIHTLTGHTDMVSGVAFSPDGSLLASTSRDGTVRLWEVRTGTPASGSTDDPAVFFAITPDAPGGKPVWTTGIAFSPDGSRLAVGATDAVVRVLALPDGRLLQTLTGHTALVTIQGVAFNPDPGETTLASASQDGTVRLWDAERGTLRGVLDHRGLPVVGLSWHPGGTLLVTSSDVSGTVLVWDAERGTVEERLPIAQGPLVALDYSPDGSVLATGGANGTLRLHMLARDHQVSLANASRTSQSLAFLSRTELVIATSSDPGSVVRFDLETRTSVPILRDLGGQALQVAISPDRSLVAAGGSDQTVTVWDIRHDRQGHVLEGPGGNISALAFDHSSTRLIVSYDQASRTTAEPDAPSEGAVLAVWDVTSGLLQYTLHGHENTITSVAAHPGRPLLASTSLDGTLRLWDLDLAGEHPGTERHRIEADEEQERFTSVAFAPDGQLMVTGSASGQVQFWSLEPLEMVHTLDIGGGSVLALAFRPDGKQLAVSSRFGGLRLFEQRGKEHP